MTAIGIDLGTTYSCVAVWRGGKIEIIANAQGNRITPSCVAFTNIERLIGEPAKNQSSMNLSNTIYDAKRLIGREFNDPKIQSDIKQWPFKVINYNRQPKIRVNYLCKQVEFYPEEISSMVLGSMKQTAEAFLGEKVKDAVITVPAYFNDSQRQATKDAGKIAGLNVLRIINEPTAAALAYGLEKNIKKEKTVLIFDLGGGTTDVSILTIKNGSAFVVKSTAGDIHLGGEDFDSRLVNYLCTEFENIFKKNIINNQRALRRLRTAAVRAKQHLSSNNVATIFIEYFVEGIDFQIDISRAKFESLCADLFTSAVMLVKQALEDANIDKMSVDDVVLVGGSTRIPKIQAMLQNFFCGKQLNFSINPDEAVAYGAAVQAALLTDPGKTSSILQNVVLQDITPLSLGFELFSGSMATIIKRNTQIPCTYTEDFTTSFNNQSNVVFSVYQGERSVAKRNNFLGEFVLTGITPEKAGVPIIDVTFDIDANGILQVKARDRASGRVNKIKITHHRGRLSRKEVERMIIDAEKYKDSDDIEREKMMAKNKLKGYIYSVLQAVDDTSSTLCRDDKEKIVKVCDEVEGWMDENKFVGGDDYINKLQEVEKKCTFIMTARFKVQAEMIIFKSELESFVLETNKWQDVNSNLDRKKKDQALKLWHDLNNWIRMDPLPEEFKDKNFLTMSMEFLTKFKKIESTTGKIEAREEFKKSISLLNEVVQGSSSEIAEIFDETENWLVENQLADKVDFDEKLLNIQEQCSLVVSKILQGVKGSDKTCQ